MKTLVKGLTALLICGSFIFSSCENVEAAEVADLTTNSVETQELARNNHRPPSPPPPGRPGSRHKDPWDRHPHRPDFDDWDRPHYPPPPPPGRDGHRPPPPPRHGW